MAAERPREIVKRPSTAPNNPDGVSSVGSGPVIGQDIYKPQSFISKYKWPLATVAGFAALGGAAVFALTSGGDNGSGDARVTVIGPTETAVAAQQVEPTVAKPTNTSIPTVEGTPFGKDGGTVPTTKPEPTKPADPTKVPTQESTKEPTAAPTKEPNKEPTPVPAKTVLDQPITPSTIDSLRKAVSDLYVASPDDFKEPDGTIYYNPDKLKGSFDVCEKGDPQDAGAPKAIAQDRLGVCAGLVKQMIRFYKLHGDSALWKIAVDTRSYFVTQYPDLKAQFDTFLKQSGVN